MNNTYQRQWNALLFLMLWVKNNDPLKNKSLWNSKTCYKFEILIGKVVRCHRYVPAVLILMVQGREGFIICLDVFWLLKTTDGRLVKAMSSKKT